MTSLNLFCPYQVKWINDAAPNKLAEKSRRVGFSYADAFETTESVVDGRGDCFYSSADLSAAREYVDYCKEFAQVYNAVGRGVASEAEEEITVPVTDEAGKVIDERKMMTLKLVFRNDLKIVAGSSNPNFFRSKGGNAKLDELAFHRDQRALIKAAHATSQFWGYRQSAWSSHHGEGSYFNQLIKQGRAGQLAVSLHRVTIYDAMEQGIVERIIMRKERRAEPPAPDNKARQDWLDGLRKTCPDQGIWEEEYECVPASDHGSLLTYEMIGNCESAELALVEDILAIPREGPAIYAGGDIGRKKDLTVIWADEHLGDVYVNRLLKRMANVKFSVQLEAFDLLLANPRVKRLCIDATGLGMMLAEMLQGKWGRYRVEAVTFTAGVKSEIAMPFVGRFQDRRARIPSDPALRESLHSVRKMVSTTGHVRLDAEHTEDGHADEFWAGALACAASEPTKRRPPPPGRKPPGW